MKEIIIGIFASLFFAVTFILNHSMEMAGGNWLWSASLRFFFMLPLLFLIVLSQKGLSTLRKEMIKAPQQWLIWSFVGFFLFYAPLTFAAAYSAGWLVSGTWQFTLIAGVLLAPFFTIYINDQKVRQKIPVKALFISMIIMIGIVLIQLPNANTFSLKIVLLGCIPVIVAAFAYPLGNRKMMVLCDGHLTTFQRVLGMTIASMPAWVLLAIYAFFTIGLPTTNQVFQSLIVAISSGIIATTLFFVATNRVRNDQVKLAAVEATQSTELIFVIIGEMLLLGIPLPSPIALIGIFIIIIGMLLHSLQIALSKAIAITTKKNARYSKK